MSTFRETEIIINTNHARRVESRFSRSDNEEWTDSEEMSIKNRIGTNEFFEKLNRSSLNAQILPKNCKYIDSCGQYKTLIIEDEPCVRTIKVNYDLNIELRMLKTAGKLEEYGFAHLLDKGPPYYLSVSFPYIIYMFFINCNPNRVYNTHIKIFYRLSPITSLSDYLLKTNLFNVNDSNNLCLNINSFNNTDLVNICSKSLDAFWLREFNNDYNHCYKEYGSDPEIGSVFSWAYYSKINPSFVFNINWIAAGNIQSNIDSYYNDYNLPSMNFNSLLAVFNKDIIDFDKGITEITDQCFSVQLDSGHILSVGDEVEYENKKYYIYSFICKQGGDVLKVKLENAEVENEIIEINFSYNYFNDQLVKNQINNINIIQSVKVKNDVEVFLGEIVEIKNIHIQGYNKIEKIRLSIDGNYEIKIGKMYFLAKNLEIEEKIDLNNICIGDIKVEYGKEYYISSSYNNRNKIHTINKYIYKEVICSNGEVYLNFRCVETGEHFGKYLHQFKNYSGFISESFNGSEYHKIFHSGFQLFPIDNYIDREKNIILLKKENIIRFGDLDANMKIPELVLFDANTKLFIPGLGLNINFNINDLVVVANWENPQEMLKVKVIKEFEVNNETKKINIIVEDQNGNKESVEYINFESGYILLNKIRKVSLEYNGIKAGTKIRANISGISGFPKKDTNQIIAFMIDTGAKYPLMLCSNYLTLHVNERTLKNFNLISTDSKKWGRLNNSMPNIDKIKHQEGDLFYKLENNIYIFYQTTTQSILRAINLVNSSLMSVFNANKYPEHKRFGFLEPRVSSGNLERTLVFTNFQGGYMRDIDYGQFPVIKDWSDYV